MKSHYYAWIIPSLDGTITPNSCHVYWIGEGRIQGMAQLPKKVFGAPERSLFALIKDGLKLIEIDGEQAYNFLRHYSELWAETLDDDRATNLLRMTYAANLFGQWIRILAEEKEIGIGLQNELPR